MFSDWLPLRIHSYIIDGEATGQTDEQTAEQEHAGEGAMLIVAQCFKKSGIRTKRPELQTEARFIQQGQKDRQSDDGANRLVKLGG